MPRSSRPINAGDQDRIITIQTVVPDQSDSGELTRNWDSATNVEIWAEWLPAGTREAYQAQQRLASYVDGVYRIYDLATRPSPDENTRILGHDGRIFDIKPYIEIGREDGLEIPVVARGEV